MNVLELRLIDIRLIEYYIILSASFSFTVSFLRNRTIFGKMWQTNLQKNHLKVVYFYFAAFFFIFSFAVDMLAINCNWVNSKKETLSFFILHLVLD